MRGKLPLTKKFGVKTAIEEMGQEIWKMSILYPKTSKKFYHHITFGKIVMNSEVFYKKSCSWKFLKKTPVLESLFNKNVGV